MFNLIIIKRHKMQIYALSSTQLFLQYLQVGRREIGQPFVSVRGTPTAWQIMRPGSSCCGHHATASTHWLVPFLQLTAGHFLAQARHCVICCIHQQIRNISSEHMKRELEMKVTTSVRDNPKKGKQPCIPMYM